MQETFLNGLDRWMKENRWTDPLLATELSRRQPDRRVTAKSVFNWRHGLRAPRARTMATLMEMSGGAVQPSTFIKRA